MLLTFQVMCCRGSCQDVALLNFFFRGGSKNRRFAVAKKHFRHRDLVKLSRNEPTFLALGIQKMQKLMVFHLFPSSTQKRPVDSCRGGVSAAFLVFGLVRL